MSSLDTADSFRISQVRISEVEVLHHLSVTTFTEAFSAKNTQENMTAYLTTGFAREQLLKELENSNSTFYFARLEGQIVGYLKLNVQDAQTEQESQEGLEIERIYILSSFQAKGIGSKLMYFAIDQARRLGKTFIWLGVWQKNTDALRFYYRYGFREFGKHPFRLGSDLQTDLLLKLNL